MPYLIGMENVHYMVMQLQGNDTTAQKLSYKVSS